MQADGMSIVKLQVRPLVYFTDHIGGIAFSSELRFKCVECCIANLYTIKARILKIVMDSAIQMG